MKIRNLCVIAIMAVSTAAFAQSSGGGAKETEYFYQPVAGQSAITPEFSYSIVDVDYSGAFSGSSDAKGWILKAIYEYGLMENLSLGVSVAYQSAETDDGTTTADYSGMGDLHVFLKGRHGLGAATFRFGADLQLSPGDAEVDVNGDASNAYSGQHSITPYVGVDLGGARSPSAQS